MTQYALNTVHQGHRSSPLEPNITETDGATAKSGAPRSESINSVGSSSYCRPHS